MTESYEESMPHVVICQAYIPVGRKTGISSASSCSGTLTSSATLASSRRRTDPELFGKTNEVCKGLGTHLFHHPATVHLDGLFHSPELVGNLLVQHTGDHEPEHLALPWGESLQPRPEGFEAETGRGWGRDAIGVHRSAK